MTETEMINKLKEYGVSNANLIKTDEIVFDFGLRTLCEANSCGQYGKNWACPPNSGTPEELKEMVLGYGNVLVFQKIYEIEDSLDIEGMTDARKDFNVILDSLLGERFVLDGKARLLGAGGCSRCRRCAFLDGKPCVFPEKLIISLEACCINVSSLAKSAGMKYINGENTVTYFGAILLK